jgi:hypothetical protein
MQDERTQDIPTSSTRDLLAKFLLPKVLLDTADLTTMRKVTAWIDTLSI